MVMLNVIAWYERYKACGLENRSTFNPPHKGCPRSESLINFLLKYSLNKDMIFWVINWILSGQIFVIHINLFVIYMDVPSVLSLESHY